MKGISISLLALLIAAPALAGGLEPKRGGETRDLPAPAHFEEAVKIPYGFYLGVEGGGQFTGIDIQDEGAHFDGVSADGLIGGVTGGFDTGFGRVKGGLCFAGGFSDVNAIAEGYGEKAELELNHYLQACGRLGLVTDGGTFVFGKLGYEWQKWTLGATGEADVDVDSQWWVVGGGIETPIKEGLSLRLSLDYLMLNDVEADGDGNSSELNSALEDSEALRGLVGVVYHFGGPNVRF